MSIVTYKDIVNIFTDAATAHLAINGFAEGAIDYLDSYSQNVKYPFMFLRPLASPGLQNNFRQLSFELYSIDVPKVSNESPVDVKSRTELFLYDVLSYMRYGPTSQYTLDFTLNSIVPVNEAFNDRAYGWVGNINVTSEGVYNYCNYPDL